MRRILSLLLLPLLILPALAQEPPNAEAPAAHPTRQTWEQRFATANLAHDGHLTQTEANGGYAAVAKHFDEIDVDHKGYVTENDIRAWRVLQKAARQRSHAPSDRLKPQHAFQLRLQDQRPMQADQSAALPEVTRTIAATTPLKP
jgi:hypothetical protein